MQTGQGRRGLLIETCPGLCWDIVEEGSIRSDGGSRHSHPCPCQYGYIFELDHFFVCAKSDEGPTRICFGKQTNLMFISDNFLIAPDRVERIRWSLWLHNWQVLGERLIPHSVSSASWSLQPLCSCWPLTPWTCSLQHPVTAEPRE